MIYTMRSAFIKWLELHDESKISNSCIRIPNWFRWHIRKNCEWTYHNTYLNKNHYRRNHDSQFIESNRSYKGYYQIEITEDELLKLKRAEWIK